MLHISKIIISCFMLSEKKNHLTKIRKTSVKLMITLNIPKFELEIIAFPLQKLFVGSIIYFNGQYRCVSLNN